MATLGSLALLASVMTACSTVQPEGYPLSATVRDCLKQGARFVDGWGCIQTRFASGQMGEPDKRLSQFLKLGDGLAGQVSAGQLTDSEARTRLSVGAGDLDKL